MIFIYVYIFSFVLVFLVIGMILRNMKIFVILFLLLDGLFFLACRARVLRRVPFHPGYVLGLFFCLIDHERQSMDMRYLNYVCGMCPA